MFFKELLSENGQTSLMRFCVLCIVFTMLGNWLLGTIGVLAGWIDKASIDISEVVALLGALSIKMGQKVVEKRNNT